MVVIGHAVAYPGAVMIHLEDTTPADRAVMSTRRLYLLAMLTKSVSNQITDPNTFSR